MMDDKDVNTSKGDEHETNAWFNLAPGDSQLERGLQSRHIQFLALGTLPHPPFHINTENLQLEGSHFLLPKEASQRIEGCRKERDMSRRWDDPLFLPRWFLKTPPKAPRTVPRARAALATMYASARAARDSGKLTPEYSAQTPETVANFRLVV